MAVQVRTAWHSLHSWENRGLKKLGTQDGVTNWERGNDPCSVTLPHCHKGSGAGGALDTDLRMWAAVLCAASLCALWQAVG